MAAQLYLPIIGKKIFENFWRRMYTLLTQLQTIVDFYIILNQI